MDYKLWIEFIFIFLAEFSFNQGHFQDIKSTGQPDKDLSGTNSSTYSTSYVSDSRTNGLNDTMNTNDNRTMSLVNPTVFNTNSTTITITNAKELSIQRQTGNYSELNTTEHNISTPDSTYTSQTHIVRKEEVNIGGYFNSLYPTSPIVMETKAIQIIIQQPSTSARQTTTSANIGNIRTTGEISTIATRTDSTTSDLPTIGTRTDTKNSDLSTISSRTDSTSSDVSTIATRTDSTSSDLSTIATRTDSTSSNLSTIATRTYPKNSDFMTNMTNLNETYTAEKTHKEATTNTVFRTNETSTVGTTVMGSLTLKLMTRDQSRSTHYIDKPNSQSKTNITEIKMPSTNIHIKTTQRLKSTTTTMRVKSGSSGKNEITKDTTTSTKMTQTTPETSRTKDKIATSTNITQTTQSRSTHYIDKPNSQSKTNITEIKMPSTNIHIKTTQRLKSTTTTMTVKSGSSGKNEITKDTTTSTKMTQTTPGTSRTKDKIATSTNITQTTSEITPQQATVIAEITTLTLPYLKFENLNSKESPGEHMRKLGDKEDDKYWPVAVAIVIGIPAIIVIGVTITVLHKKRKLENARHAFNGNIPYPMEYDV